MFKGFIPPMLSLAPRKYNEPKSFKEICETLDYDPAEELIARRNELCEEAETYPELANEEAEKVPQDCDMIGAYLEKATTLRNHVESLDLKLLPFLYARKSDMTVSDKNGNSLFGAFADAVKGNLKVVPNG